MKKKLYLTLDTETCTLPFVNGMTLTPKEKQKISIAKPLVYDIGWVISDSKGKIIKKENYLVQETFFVPNVFNTAYYSAKRPLYIEMLNAKQISAKNWNDIMDILIADLKKVDISVAYNCCFDFKKAIPFTESYISHLYSVNYANWESEQEKSCVQILAGTSKPTNPNYLDPIFDFRGNTYPIADLWGIACDKLINANKYKKYCLDNDKLTNSTKFFSTSAETSFQYLANQHSFVESHTALSDSEIESQILTKVIKKGKVIPTIEPFPFRNLGTTFDFTKSAKANSKYVPHLKDLLKDYIDSNNGWTSPSIYWIGMVREYNSL